jgi:hypothetical protein
VKEEIDAMTEKQLRAIVLEVIQEVLLAEITALRADVRELRKYSRESLEQVRAMRQEFSESMEHLNQQLQRITQMMDERLPDDEAEKPWMADNWKASAGAGTPPHFERELSYSAMQTRLSQMEYRLGILEKALQRN